MKIPNQLKKEDFRFIKLKTKDKIPFEINWTETANYDYKEIENWNGNYGVMGGRGDLIIIDFDDKEFQEKIVPKLPNTFTTITGSGGLHLYFTTNRPESFKIFDDKKNTLCDVQGKGKQAVGANSTHPNGYKYVVGIDRDIAFISFAELKAIFAPYTNIWKETQGKLKFKEQTVKDPLIREIRRKIQVLDVLSKYGITISKNPTECPFHASKRGMCLSFTDDLWHCFHCEKGGDIFTLVMEKENIDFPEAKKVLMGEAGIKIEEGTIIEKKKKPEIIWADDLINSEIPEPAWVIQDLIPTESVNILGGDSGSLKTYLALYMGFCVAHGLVFLNSKSIQGNVLYIDEENGLITFKKRISKIKNGLDVTDKTPIGILTFSNIKFDKEEWKKPFAELIEEVNPSLIIVDSMVRVLSGEEDKADAVKKVFDFCKPFISKCKCSFLFLHHTRKKEGERVKEDLRGSGDLAAMCDSVLIMNKISENFYILNQVKNRHQEDCQPMKILVNDPNKETIQIQYGGEAPRKRQSKIDECREILQEWILNGTFISFGTGEAVELSGYSKPTVLKSIKGLLVKGIVKSRVGNKWLIDEGRRFVDTNYDKT